MIINSNFDGGNIECIAAKDPKNVQLKIRQDHNSNHFQWFYFRVSQAGSQALCLNILNAAQASYPEGWNDYRAVASYDRKQWFRVPTHFDGRVLSIHHTPSFDSVYYAYFAPYSLERHEQLIAKSQMSPLVRLEVLGQSLDGRDIDFMQVGETSKQKHNCWIIARQHPGETMAEWLIEGLLARLLDEQDPIARVLRSKATFYIVPNMNPDGSFRGHLRTNAAGANLNREWQNPSMERSPEVALVRQKMQTTGVDFFLDVHGDEALPYNFISGADGVRSVKASTYALQARYEKALMQANPDFQTEHGYVEAKPGEANMTMATNYIADAFSCLAMTLEQPFKDTKDSPNEQVGWSPQRCQKLGFSNLDALYAVIDELR